jgi:co-chaperonin GroES (HSP10)
MKITKNTIHPVKDYLLIEVPDQGSETSSGLLLSEASDNKMPVVGTVLKVGNKAEYEVGDEIIFRKFSADEIKVTTAESEKSFWLLSSDEVIAIVKDSESSKIKDREQITLKKLSANETHNADEKAKSGKKSTS